MKKRFFNYIVPVALFAILFSACESKLELEPHDAMSEDQALKTYDGLTLSLTGTYDVIQENGSYGQDYIQVGEVLVNDIYWDGSYTSYRDLADKAPTTANVEAEDLWNTAYEGINQANKIIYAVDNYEIDDPRYASNKDRIKGEALYIRAILHWQLVTFFAQPPGYTADNSHPGVPIKVEPTMNPEDALAKPSRDAVADVYGQIITDLNDAASLMPETNPSRATKYSALAFLSRVYLQNGQNTEAAEAANQVITSNMYSLLSDPVKCFKTKNTEETIFEVQMTESDNIANTNEALANYFYVEERDEIHIPQHVIDRYNDNDLRKSNFFYYTTRENEDGTFDTTWYSNKWTDIYQNVPTIRYPEVLLNRAEALANLNGLNNESENLVNMLRTRATVGDIDPANADELMEAIKNERKLELVHEGIRINDLRRWRATDIGNSNSTNQFTVPWNDDHMILPIPQRERDVNANLSQNPGY
jgi:hypothetical protein